MAGWVILDPDLGTVDADSLELPGGEPPARPPGLYHGTAAGLLALPSTQIVLRND